MKPIKVLIIIVVIISIIFATNKLMNKIDKEKVIEEVQSIKQIDNELQKIMDEENFKKATILRARKVANDNKKAIELDRNKKALDLIEAEYESIRNEELLLTGDKDVSLK